MQPIPCNHCGFNFMRQSIDPEAQRLCHSCALREEIRSPTKKDAVKTIDIVIKCPVTMQAEIEEYCINNGMDFTKYFLSIHELFKNKKDALPSESIDEIIDPKPLRVYSAKGKKK